MRIDVRDHVAATLGDELWPLYNAAFEELRSTAVQRHLMSREEFDDVMADRRVAKVLAVESSDSMPLISPDYFERRWPAHFAEGRIWYIGFVAVHPRHRSTGAFEMVVEHLYRTVVANDGLAALDVCSRNEDLYRLPQAIHRLLESWSGVVRSDRMDAQSYWLYEFPSAA
jgi:ribosomal protein S18 acetylase RimI-like enzyme